MTQHHRVLVVGAGPAGSALSLVLARAKVSVLLVEQGEFEGTRVGELLSPDGVHILSQMLPGVGEEHLQLPLSVVSAWRTNELTSDQDGTELPWRAIDRVGLDKRIAAEAAAAGATLRTGARIRNRRRIGGALWEVDIEKNGEVETFTTDLLVDATGRASLLAKTFGAVRIRQSGQVALVGFLRSDSRVEVPHEMVLETTASGWWYAAPIKLGSAVAVFITDNDLDRGQPDEAWRQAFDASVHVRDRFRDFELLEKPRRVSADSSLLLPSFGEGWMAVGDAAACFDPLSIHGLGRSLLKAARVGGYLVDCFAAGEAPNPVKLSEENGEEFLKETLELSQWYRLVKQWPDSLFWQRRDQGYSSAETGRQKRRPRSTTSKLLFATDQVFECQQCGRCQRSAWPRLGSPGPGTPSEPVDFPAVGVEGAERPPFCQLPSAKLEGDARACGQFPFLLRETADGIVVGVSPLCRSVQRREGKPLSEYESWVRQLIEQRPPGTISKKVAVTWGRGIEWEEYRSLEVELLAPGDLDERLRTLRWQLCLWACEPNGSLRDAREGPGEPPDTFMAWLENLLVGAILCCLEIDPKTNSSELFRNLIEDNPVHFARVGWKGRFSELGDSKRLGDVAWIVEEAARYQRSLIERKFLVIRTPLLHNLCLLSILPSFLLTYSMLLSLHRGARAIEREDYYRALELAEMELVTYGRLDQLPHIIVGFHLDQALEQLEARKPTHK